MDNSYQLCAGEAKMSSHSSPRETFYGILRNSPLWILFVLLLADVSSSKECPSDPRLAGRHCLVHYLDLTRSNDINYFTGIDIETVRMICNSLETFAHCLRDMSENCLGVDPNDQILPDNVIGVWKMCSTPGFNQFFDLYARNQYCFQTTQVRSISLRCYNDFRAKTDVYTVENEASSFSEACRTLGTLESCVSNTVFSSCKTEEAYQMVPRLVQATVPWSHRCHVTEAPVTPPASTASVNGISRDQASQRQETYWYNGGSRWTPAVPLHVLTMTTVLLLQQLL